MNKTKEEKIALVVEGGAMRGIFSTGVLDALIEADYNPFDLCIGVSAGALNIAAYLAKMKGRNYKIFTDYSLDDRFINPINFLKGGHLMDLDWMWETTIRELRLDLDAIEQTPSEYIVGMTEIKSGKIKYIKPSRENLEVVLKASSSVPILYRTPIAIEGVAFWDGGITDPIPVKEAIRRGATKIVVLRSRKYGYQMADKNKLMARLSLRKYPAMVEAVANRPSVYNETINFMRGESSCDIIEICPSESFQTGRLTKDKKILDADYKLGYAEGKKLLKHLQNKVEIK